MLNRRQILSGLGTVALASLLPRALWAAGSIKPDEASALLVIDVQNCFLPGGSLAVKDGEQVVPVINKLAKAFSNVVLTQDWHTGGHISFASSHAGKKPFETVDLDYGKQVLWPDHCVQGTDGAALSKDLEVPATQPSPRRMARPRPGSLPISGHAISSASFWRDLRPISVWHGAPSMRARRALRPM
jgi:nicotinamidase/pyrazinamidase